MQPYLFGFLNDNLWLQLDGAKFVHVAHHEVHSRERKEQKVYPKEGWHMESKVPFIWQGDGEPLSFLKVWDVTENDYGFADDAYWVERDPHGVAQPGQNVEVLLVEL